MNGPTRPAVPYPMHVCGADGVVYDERRDRWYGTPEEVGEKLHCPACGTTMEAAPREPPVRVYFCYQCGTTFDRVRGAWYGLAFHTPTMTT
jgi:hypothetical protein